MYFRGTGTLTWIYSVCDSVIASSPDFPAFFGCAKVKHFTFAQPKKAGKSGDEANSVSV